MVSQMREVNVTDVENVVPEDVYIEMDELYTFAVLACYPSSMKDKRETEGANADVRHYLACLRRRSHYILQLLRPRAVHDPSMFYFQG